jgi:DNA-binding MarR family transcriptional regulator
MPSQTDFIDAATRLQRAAAQLGRRIGADGGATHLSLNKVAVLARLQREGPATGSALAAYLRLQPQSLTRLLASLALDGLVVRRPDAQDGRQSLIELTPAGLAALTEDFGARRARLAHAMEAALSAEDLDLLVQAVALMDRLSNALAAQDPR